MFLIKEKPFSDYDLIIEYFFKNKRFELKLLSINFNLKQLKEKKN